MRTRRQRLLLIESIAGVLFVAAIGLSAWWSWPRPFALTPTPGQNVVLVTIDTLRADRLAMYGGPVETPNLDQLARHGAKFTFAHAHAVVTLPSHTSILTGRYPFEHGVRDNLGYRIAADAPTMATRLRDGGYATAAFIGGFPLTRRFGLTPGFDTYDDEFGGGQPGDFSLPERRADAVVARAVDWIDRQPGKFFAWVHLFDPHSPYTPPAPFDAKYAAAPYNGEVAWTDYALGPLLDRLAARAGNTLVIVTADHGESLGDHGEETHGLFAYEGTLRVPLIIADTGTAAPVLGRTTIDSPARHIDIVPTVLDAVGLPKDPSLPGTSLLPPINDFERVDRPQYFEAMTNMLARGWAPLRGVISDRGKYIDLPIPEFYNLANDPREARNLFDDDPVMSKVMMGILESYHAPLPGAPRVEVATTNAQLQALGYTAGTSAAPKARYTEADDPKRLVDLDRDLHAASALFEHGRVDEAIAAFERVIAARPTMGDGYRYEAAAYWQSNRPQQAVQTIERAFANGVTDRDLRVRLARYLTDRGDTARAVAILEPLAAVDDVEALNALGVAYGRQAKTAPAIQAFNRVLALDPSNGLAYQNLGTAHLTTGNLGAAESCLRKALELDPSLSGAYTALGVVLARTNRTEAAIDAWRRALSLDPNDADARDNLGALTGIRK